MQQSNDVDIVWRVDLEKAERQAQGSPSLSVPSCVEFGVLILRPSLIQLYDGSNRVIVEYERHVWSKKKPTLEVSVGVLPQLDMILIGWITVSRDIKRSANASDMTDAAENIAAAA